MKQIELQCIVEQNSNTCVVKIFCLLDTGRYLLGQLCKIPVLGVFLIRLSVIITERGKQQILAFSDGVVIIIFWLSGLQCSKNNQLQSTVKK